MPDDLKSRRPSLKTKKARGRADLMERIRSGIKDSGISFNAEQKSAIIKSLGIFTYGMDDKDPVVEHVMLAIFSVLENGFDKDKYSTFMRELELSSKYIDEEQNESFFGTIDRISQFVDKILEERKKEGEVVDLNEFRNEKMNR